MIGETEENMSNTGKSVPLRGGLATSHSNPWDGCPVYEKNRQERRKQKKFDRIKQKQLRKGIK